MLVLSRKAGEAICIGAGISITVLCVRGKGVSLGISAPREVPVKRTELSCAVPSRLPRNPAAELAEVREDH